MSLRLTSPDGTQTFWDNHELENGVWSTTDGSEDVINSTECVFVQAPAPGGWRVDVVASSVIQDNHVETPAVDADYGLVMTGSAPVLAGETRHFQYWYRDALGGSATSNFSSAQSLTFE